MKQRVSLRTKLNKGTVLPSIKNSRGTVHDFYDINCKKNPEYYYSLRFERNRLGTISTRVIKETVSKIRKKCKSIASMSEKALTENSSTTDTRKFKKGYLQKISKLKAPVNKNHLIRSQDQSKFVPRKNKKYIFDRKKRKRY